MSIAIRYAGPALSYDRPPTPCDVLIVGGGLTGLTAAAVLTAERPELSLLVLEADARPGGQPGNVSAAADTSSSTCCMTGARSSA